MSRISVVTLCATLLAAGAFAQSRPRVTQEGRAIVQYSSPAVKAVAAYEYSRRNHSGPWLLIELAVQAKERIAIERTQISLLTPDERMIPLATQQEFLDDQDRIRQLLQNATVSRRPLGAYFTTHLQATIQFFSFPGRIVHDSFVTNLDEVAAGDLLFKSPGRGWAPGTYRLVISHPDAPAALPIELD
jgi:hypothetical protein